MQGHEKPFFREENMKKHKVIFTLLTASALFAAMGTLAACGDDSDEGKGFYYWKSDDGLSYCVAVDSEYKDTWENADLVIPAEYKGKPVTEISTGAFEETGIKSVTFSDNIKIVASSAFRDCENLKTVNWGKNITKIESSAFHNTGLETIALPAHVTDIESSAFAENKHLKTATVNGNAVLGDMVFDDCIALESVQFMGEERLTLGVQTFGDCSALKSITINADSATLDEGVFINCKLDHYSANVNVVLDSIFSESPKALTLLHAEEIPENFYYNSQMYNVTCITLPATLKRSKKGALAFPKLNKVIFEGTLKNWCEIELENVGSTPLYSFNESENCELFIDGKLVEGKLTIPEGTSKISQYAFFRYDKITEVEIPSSVTEIGEYAFAQGGNIYSAAFSEGLKTIGDNAFEQNALVEVTLPQSIETLGNYLFHANRTLIRVINKTSFTNAQINEKIGKYYFSDYLEILTEADGSAAEKAGDFLFWKDADGNYSFMRYIGSEKQITLPAAVNGSAYAIHAYAFKGFQLEKITFADTANWYIQYGSQQANPIDVTTPETNAANLQSEYLHCEWYQMEN